MSDPLYWIGTGSLRAGITSLGAALWDLRLANVQHSLVLGFATAEAYRASRTHAGAVGGRVCNRVGHAQARLGERVLQLDANLHPHHVHGGRTGFSQQVWQVKRHEPNRLILTLISPDGHEGYPGNLRVRATYIASDKALRLDLTAASDAPTLVNLCHHPYFNLSGAPTVADHWLWISAQNVLALDPTGCPTGSVSPVSRSHFDFCSSARQLGAGPFDQTFPLADSPRAKASLAATLQAGVRMELWTTQAALHLYDGSKIAQGTHLRDGRVVGPQAGICLEAQGWTDAPNHQSFPSIELQPNAPWHQTSQYRFSCPEGPNPSCPAP